jgi:hypothetical protein
MLVYFFLINHVRLSRFNNNTRLGAQWRSTAVGLIPGFLIIATLASGNEIEAVLGAGWLWLWLALQIRQWWVPYLFGQTALHRDFRWYVAGGYDKTIRLLPERVGRPSSDLQHLILQVLTLLAAMAVSVAAADQRRNFLFVCFAMGRFAARGGATGWGTS